MIAFLMDEHGAWRVSPAYDLTFSFGPNGEHSTMIMGEGKNPTLNHLLRLAAIGEIKKPKALEIIEHVHSATNKWKDCAESTGVSKPQIKRIGETLASVKNIFTNA
ncbi:MAG TPA: hypothetical protein PLV31_06870 [Gammaproteobacteria bacterium]|nr:hypothetical protein [Gammaproteobacteria bacterium]HQZ88384.1 hypothetical protein [Gammaproteobacteria bacterium]HRA43377.1 hypothetical protein [Gammaproteobacteria bacterium]